MLFLHSDSVIAYIYDGGTLIGRAVVILTDVSVYLNNLPVRILYFASSKHTDDFLN